MPTALKAVIFDIDGTMIPNTPYHAKAFMELGTRHNVMVTPEDYSKRFHARSNQEIITAMFGDGLTQSDIQRIAREKEQIYRDLYSQHFSEVPGLKHLIADLITNGICCAAASNGPRENVDMAVNMLGLNNQLKFSLAFEDVTRGKPAPDLFLKASTQLACAPESCLVFEDSHHGFDAARAAGMSFIAVDSDQQEKASKHAPDALHVITNYLELSHAVLQEIFNGK